MDCNPEKNVFLPHIDIKNLLFEIYSYPFWEESSSYLINISWIKSRFTHDQDWEWHVKKILQQNFFRKINWEYTAKSIFHIFFERAKFVIRFFYFAMQTLTNIHIYLCLKKICVRFFHVIPNVEFLKVKFIQCISRIWL